MQTLSELLPLIRTLDGHEAIRWSNGYVIERWTYKELYGRIGACIGLLREQGLKQGDRTMVWADNRPEWVAFFWACVASGIHVVPVDVNFSPELLARIQKDSGAKLIVNNDVMDAVSRRRDDANFSVTPVLPDDIAEIIYTSGTTGEPRGIGHRHRHICANLDPFQREIAKYRHWAAPFQPIRILDLLPLSHMFGQSMGLFVPLFLGGAATFTNEIRSDRIMQLVHDQRVSVVVAVPRMLENLRHEVERAFTLPSPGNWRGIPGIAQQWWRYRNVHSRFGWKFWSFVSGGARLAPELEEFWGRLGFVVLQGYGLTEASPVVAVNHPFSSRRGSVGKPVPGQEVRIAPDGEILVRGESVAGATDSDGWLHTGDLGELDAEGRLYYRGRKKDVIVTAEGLNVFPDDVENVLKQFPEIQDCAVVSIRDEVHAAIISRNRGIVSQDMDALVHQANARLEAHQRVRYWSIWPGDDFPRTASTLKLKRAEVAAQVIAGPHTAAIDAPVDPSAMSSLERVELLSELELKHGVDIDEEAFTKIATTEGLKQFMANPTQARTAARLSDWPLAIPVRALRAVFQRGIAIPLFRNRLKLSVEGLENLDGLEQPVIFAVNHSSDLDTPAIFTALPSLWRKRLAPAMRADYFGPTWKSRIEYFLARLLYNTYPLPQEVTGTRSAMDFTAGLVRRGYCPLIYPEGSRTRDGALQPFRPGVGMMAVRLRIPVVPIHIRGLFEIYSVHDSWPRAGPVHVKIGAPLRFSSGTRFEDAAAQIHDAPVFQF